MEFQTGVITMNTHTKSLSPSATLHRRALAAAKRFFQVEAELLDILLEMDRTRAFEEFGYASLFAYTTQELKLSESVALGFINVARKTAHVPELREAIAQGELSVSKAHKIASVLKLEDGLAKESQQPAREDELVQTSLFLAQEPVELSSPTPAPPPSNKDWIEKAKTLSTRALEKEVAKANPQAPKPDRVQATSDKRVQLSVNLDEKVMEAIRRVQDLESQRLQRAATLEEALAAMGALYLERKDPVIKAKRAEAKGQPFTGTMSGGVKSVTPRSPRVRQPIPAAVEHQVMLRDRGQCTQVNTRGQRCESRRWLQNHHMIEVRHGGSNEPENLVTLCSAHHRQKHFKKHGEKRGRAHL
jgi:5-methylcytosine-specific restriction endonuclease McrA